MIGNVNLLIMKLPTSQRKNGCLMGQLSCTAVFLIKYMRTLGFSATNDIFAGNAWYFRNTLVRTNYTNVQKGIHETTQYDIVVEERCPKNLDYLKKYK